MNNAFFSQWIITLLFVGLALSSTLNAQRPVDEIMGVNTRTQDPIDRMQAVGFIREYHRWYYNEGFPTVPFNETGSPAYPNNQYRWNQAYQNLTYTLFDDFYQEIQDSNIIICPTALGGILQVIDPNGTIPFNDPNITPILEQKPVPPGADTLLPASYIAHADYMYQFAARYGSTPFSPARESTLIAPKTHPNETVKTGLGHVTYFENWNEQDKKFYPNFPQSYFSPAAYAAMYSADYDGHEQTLGLVADPDNPNNMISTVGIKNADPNMNMVMGGLTDADLDYIRDMVDWFKANRSPNATFGQIPLDAINIHIYVGDNEQLLASNFGISPESAGLKDILSEFVVYRDSLMPGIELWLSEFGYDTNDNSSISTPTIGNNDNYEVQGQWIVRFYLETVAAGFDRAILFDLRDICTQPACALFQSSGLLENQDSLYRPKNSWYYTYTMKNVLTGMEFSEDLSACADTTCTRVYKFTDPQNVQKAVYAVWSPTASDTTYSYQLDLEGANAATLVEMELPSIYGVPSALSGTNPTIQVSERPVFVVVGDTYFTPSPCIANLSVENTTCSTVQINWDNAGGAAQFQLWRQNGHLGKDKFTTRAAQLVSDEVDATLSSYTVADLAAASDYTFFLIPEGIGISDTMNYCAVQVTTGSSTCKIPIDTSWIFDAFLNRENAYDLVDEQSFDPICQPNSGNPITIWGFDSNSSTDQERLSLDLQDYYFIDGITIFDDSGIGFLTVQIADSPNGPWTTVEYYQTIAQQEWVTFTNSIPPDKPIRYLRFIGDANDQMQIGELILCGRLSNFTADIPPGGVRNIAVESATCFDIQLSWDAPFDKDINHYKIIFGNEEQVFPHNASNQTVNITNLEADSTYNFSVITMDDAGQESSPVVINASTLPEGECDLGCNPSCACQICLKPSWLSYEVEGNSISLDSLVDEQGTAPICGSGGNPTTTWGYDFGSVEPVVLIDLQQVYNIENFRIYDTNGMDTFRVEYRNTLGEWEELFEYFTFSFGSWAIIGNLDVNTRYLRISKFNSDARVNEIAICGTPVCTGTIITQLSAEICAGETFFFNGADRTTSGFYFDTLFTAQACDSLVQLDLTVLDTFQTEQFESICQGESYLFKGQTISETGIYRDTLTASNTCDSFIVLNLSVLDTFQTELFESICQGENYPFNGQTLTDAGIYRDTLTASNTCDSFIVLNLSILDTFQTELFESICQGENYPFNGQNLTATGIYHDTLTASNTCDSFIVLNLSVLDTFRTEQFESICQGENYPFNGQNLTATGIYHDTLTASNTCDSFIVLDLVVFDTARTAFSDTICDGDTYFFNGQDLAIEGIYRDTLANEHACDSFIVLDLIVLEEGDFCDDGNANTINDSLDVNCNCVGEVVNPTICEVTVTLSDDTIRVENMIQPLTQLDIYDEAWAQIVYTCGPENCNVEEEIILPEGIYHVKVQSWTPNFEQLVCDLIVDVEIVSAPVSNTCDVTVAINEDTIKVNNLNQPITILDVYNADWSQVVYNCGDEDCNTIEVISGLADGIYHVKVQSWTAGWQVMVCDTVIDVEIGMTPPEICDVEIITGSDYITVNNLDEPLVSMFIFTGDYLTTLFHCDYGNCPTSKTLSGLQPGAYVVKVQSYTANFQEEVCNFLQTVIVGENTCYYGSQTYIFGDISSGIYHAENSILSSGLVKPDTVVTFTAENSITLDSGFHAMEGSTFIATIGSCDSGSITETTTDSRNSSRPLTAEGFLKIAPNPFKQHTFIHYNLPNKTQEVSLYVYDMAGQVIRKDIQKQVQPKGLYTIEFHGEDLLSGMYFIALKIDGEVLIEKIAVIN